MSYAQSRSVLVFSKTEIFRHESIPAGIHSIQKLGADHAFSVQHSENAGLFVYDTLKQYDAVIFLNTTGDVLNNDQQEAFKKYINAGGGFVGIHSATDTEYDWPWYNKLVGAYFKSHPDQQEAIIQISGHKHLSTKDLPKKWRLFEEWYNFKNISTSLIVLATLDESSYKGGENGVYHPIAWCQNYDGGKMFYTALGHRKETYSNPLFIKHLLGGILYVLE